MKETCPTCKTKVSLRDNFEDCGDEDDRFAEPCRRCKHSADDEDEMPCRFCTNNYSGLKP